MAIDHIPASFVEYSDLPSRQKCCKPIMLRSLLFVIDGNDYVQGLKRQRLGGTPS
jgi:hypothetical protein